MRKFFFFYSESILSGFTKRRASMIVPTKLRFLARGVVEANMDGTLEDFIFMGWRRVEVWWSCVPASTLVKRLTEVCAGGV